MMSPLKEVATIFGGIRPTTRTETPPTVAQPALLQAKDLASREAIQWDRLPLVASNPVKKHILQKGDVLVLLRGAMLRAILIESPPPRDAVASNHIAVIRPDLRRMQPAFLVTILNHPTTRNRTRAHTSGTTIPFLTLKSLKEIDVPHPPLKEQAQIARMDRLRREFQELSERRVRLVGQIVDALIQQEVMEGPSC